jgi:hypothetical protein
MVPCSGEAAKLESAKRAEELAADGVLFASRGIPISQEERSARKRDREFESLLLRRRVSPGSRIRAVDPSAG